MILLLIIFKPSFLNYWEREKKKKPTHREWGGGERERKYYENPSYNDMENMPNSKALSNRIKQRHLLH